MRKRYELKLMIMKIEIMERINNIVEEEMGTSFAEEKKVLKNRERKMRLTKNPTNSPGSILRPSSSGDARAEQRNGQVKNLKPNLGKINHFFIEQFVKVTLKCLIFIGEWPSTALLCLCLSFFSDTYS